MFRQFRFFCIGYLALAHAVSVAAAESTILPVAGEPFTATLASLADGKLKLSAAGKPRTMAFNELVLLGDFKQPRRGPIWFLTDGGQLVAGELKLEQDRLIGQSSLMGTVELPVGVVIGVLVRPPADLTSREEIVRKILGAENSSDQLILDNGDVLAGTIEAIASDSVRLATDSGPMEVEMRRIAAVVFNPALAEKPDLPKQSWMLGFSDGSRIRVQDVTANGDLVVFHRGNHKYQCPQSALVAMQTFGEHVRYLSDLSELSFKHVPYLQLRWPLQKDANVLANPLRARGNVYLKGLGMHTAARVAYKVDPADRQFQAELAIDDSAGGKGSAVCSVFVDDGSGQWQSRYTSPTIRGGDPPIPVRIDLRGVKAISLLADFADRADELDHVDWLNARFVK